MALTLVEAAKLSTNQLRRGVIESMVESYPLLEVLPWIDVTGNAFQYTREGVLSGAQFRAVNEAYTESTGTVVNVITPLAIMGGDADVDKYIVRTRGGAVEDHRAVQTALKAKAVRRLFANAFVNGNSGVDAKQFDGLNALLTGTVQEIDAATNGLSIRGADDAARQTFFDAIDALLAAVPGANALLMNSNALGAIRSSARRLTIGNQTKTDFGTPVFTYAGVALIDIGTQANDSLIIPNNEVQGSGTNTTSIYAVRMDADNGVVGLTNGGVMVTDLGEIAEKPVFRTRVELYGSVAVQSAKSAGVLRGVIAVA